MFFASVLVKDPSVYHCAASSHQAYIIFLVKLTYRCVTTDFSSWIIISDDPQTPSNMFSDINQLYHNYDVLNQATTRFRYYYVRRPPQPSKLPMDICDPILLCLNKLSRPCYVFSRSKSGTELNNSTNCWGCSERYLTILYHSK